MLSFAVSKLNKALSPLLVNAFTPKKATREDEDKLVKLLTAMQDPEISAETRTAILHAHADSLGIELSTPQIKIILQDQSATLEKLLKFQPYQVKPNVKLTLQFVLALAAIHFPGSAASIISTHVLSKAFERVAGLYGPKAVKTGLFLLNFYFNSYSPRGLANYYVGKCFENYGLVTYAAGPIAWSLYEKSSDILSNCRFYTDFLGITEPAEPLFPVSDAFFSDETPSFSPQFAQAQARHVKSAEAIENSSKALVFSR